MSLNDAERQQTSAELRANFEKSARTLSSIQTALDFTEQQLSAALGVTAACRPEDVWLLRDYLDRVVRGFGQHPQAYTHLTDAARTAAAGWFPLRTPPPD